MRRSKTRPTTYPEGIRTSAPVRPQWFAPRALSMALMRRIRSRCADATVKLYRWMQISRDNRHKIRYPCISFASILSMRSRSYSTVLQRVTERWLDEQAELSGLLMQSKNCAGADTSRASFVSLRGGGMVMHGYVEGSGVAGRKLVAPIRMPSTRRRTATQPCASSQGLTQTRRDTSARSPGCTAHLMVAYALKSPGRPVLAKGPGRAAIR